MRVSEWLVKDAVKIEEIKDKDDSEKKDSEKIASIVPVKADKGMLKTEEKVVNGGILSSEDEDGFPLDKKRKRKAEPAPEPAIAPNKDVDTHNKTEEEETPKKKKKNKKKKKRYIEWSDLIFSCFVIFVTCLQH